MFREQAALDREDLLEQRNSFGLRFRPEYRTVVDPAHADGVDVLVLSVLANALFPVVGDAGGVRDEVVVVFVSRPFARVTPEHWLCVRRTHDDRVVVGDLSIPGKR